MKREIAYSNQAIKGLNKMPEKQATRMRKSLNMIAADETTGLDIKRLKGVKGFRLRVGDYRAVYTIDMVIMNVEKIGPRGGIY